MAIEVIGWCVVALLATAPVAIFAARREKAGAFIYVFTLLISAVALVTAVWVLASGGTSAQTSHLPVGLPWLGSHLRLDPLAAAFLVVVNLGA